MDLRAVAALLVVVRRAVDCLRPAVLAVVGRVAAARARLPAPRFPLAGCPPRVAVDKVVAVNPEVVVRAAANPVVVAAARAVVVLPARLVAQMAPVVLQVVQPEAPADAAVRRALVVRVVRH